MGEHSTWFHLIPAFKNLEAWASHYLKREWQLPIVGLTETHFTLVHVVISALVAVSLMIAAMAYARKAAAAAAGQAAPEATFGVRNFFELIIEATLSLGSAVMGREKAERYLPLYGSLVFFILFNNLVGLIPGFVPATDTLKTNLALALVVFLVTHVAGLFANGLGYLKHFMGPIWWLAPLMLVIEVISHVVRPISLSLRLLGNMFADHKVLATFFVLVPILVPLPFYFLGILVCVVQTLVFTLLSMVYIDMATAHEGH